MGAPEYINYIEDEISSIVQKSKFVHDHRGATLSIKDASLRHIGIFRDPIDRLISHFKHIARPCIQPGRSYDHVYHPPALTGINKRLAEREEDIVLLARKGFVPFITSLNNGHTRLKHLGNYYMSYLLYAEPKLREAYHNDPDYHFDEALQVVLCSIASFESIGLLSDYDISVLMICHAFGFPPPAGLEKLNASEPKKNAVILDDILQGELRHACRHDLILFERITSLYEKKKADFLIKTGRLTPFDYVDKYYEQCASGACKKSIEKINFTMGSSIPGAGWRQRNRERDGCYCAWTGILGRAQLNFYIERQGDKQVELLIRQFIAPQQVINLALEADGKPLTYAVRFGLTHLTLVALLPKNESLQGKLTRINIIPGKLGVSESFEPGIKVMGFNVTPCRGGDTRQWKNRLSTYAFWPIIMIHNAGRMIDLLKSKRFRLLFYKLNRFFTHRGCHY